MSVCCCFCRWGGVGGWAGAALAPSPGAGPNLSPTETSVPFTCGNRAHRPRCILNQASAPAASLLFVALHFFPIRNVTCVSGHHLEASTCGPRGLSLPISRPTLAPLKASHRLNPHHPHTLPVPVLPSQPQPHSSSCGLSGHHLLQEAPLGVCHPWGPRSLSTLGSRLLFLCLSWLEGGGAFFTAACLAPARPQHRADAL